MSAVMAAPEGEFTGLTREFMRWCDEGMALRGPSGGAELAAEEPSVLERFCQITGADEDVAHDSAACSPAAQQIGKMKCR